MVVIGSCPGKGKIDINIEALAGISGQWPEELETYFLPHVDTSPVCLAYGVSLL